MPESPLVVAHRLLEQAIDAMAAVAGPSASEAELLSVLTACEGTARRLERLSVGTIADLERRGTFAKRGYKSTVKALGDLLGWEWFDARRRLTVAEQTSPRIGLDATVLPAKLTATAAVYAAGDCSLRQVEVVARVLRSAAAARLTPHQWALAEQHIAAKAGEYCPTDLHAWATALVETLDQDGPEPDDRAPAAVNEMFLTRNPNGAGGKIKGRIDDAAMYDAIATVIDAHAKPVTSDDGARPRLWPTSAASSSTTATCPTAAANVRTST